MAMILLSNGIVAFGLNLSVFLLIGKTSALAMNVAGVVKDWLLIGLSALIFHSQVILVEEPAACHLRLPQAQTSLT